MKTFITSLAALTLTAGIATAEMMDKGKVYFTDLENGAEVMGPVSVRFGLKGMGVAPAGVDYENTGHHHILLNRPAWGEGEDDMDMMEYGIYADDNHIHFGKGQTETMLDLAPGKHTLQLVLGDLNHVPIKGAHSEQITILVK